MNISSYLVKIIFVLIGGVMITPLIFAQEMIFPFIVPKSLYYRFLIECIVLLWVILIVLDSQYRPKLSFIYISLCIYAVIVIISSLFGVNIDKSWWSSYERMQGIFDLLHWVTFILVLSSMCQRWQHWHRLIVFNLVIATLIYLFYILSINGLVNPIFNKSLLGNTTYFALYAIFISYLSILLLVKNYARNNILHVSSVLYSIVLLFSIYIILDVDSRTSIISILVSIAIFAAIYLYYIYLNKFKRILLLCSIISVIVCAAALYYIFDGHYIFHQIFFHWLYNNIIDLQRWVVFLASIDAFLAKPILGWGLENYNTAWTLHINSVLLEVFDQSHNHFLDILVETGLFGIISYIAVCLLALYVLIRSLLLTEQKERLFIFCTGVFFVIYYVYMFFTFDFAVSLLYFVVIISLIIIFEQQYNFFNQSKSRMRILFDYMNQLICKKYFTNYIYSLLFKYCVIAIICGVFALSLVITSKQYVSANNLYTAITTNSNPSNKIQLYDNTIQNFDGLSIEVYKQMLLYTNNMFDMYWKQNMQALNHDRDTIYQLIATVDDIEKQIDEKNLLEYSLYSALFNNYIQIYRFDNNYLGKVLKYSRIGKISFDRISIQQLNFDYINLIYDFREKFGDDVVAPSYLTLVSLNARTQSADAVFTGAPEHHAGKQFTVHLHFSDYMKTSEIQMFRRNIKVVNGVLAHGKLSIDYDTNKRIWSFDVIPDNDQDVMIYIFKRYKCNRIDLCTYDRRLLGSDAAYIIPY